MTDLISGKEFLDCFNNSIIEYIDNSLLDYNKLEKEYMNSTNWTNQMNYIMQVVEKNLVARRRSQNNHAKMFKEYFKIDYSIWTQEYVEEGIKNNILEFTGNTKHEKRWEILAAIEHENDCTDWLYEMKQLLCFNTSLKVLISYEKDRRVTNNPDILEKILNTYAKTNRLNIGDEFLFIFGNTSDEVKKNGIEFASLCFKVVEDSSPHKYSLIDQSTFNVKSNTTSNKE